MKSVITALVVCVSLSFILILNEYRQGHFKKQEPVKTAPSYKVFISKIAHRDSISVYIMLYGDNTYLITDSPNGMAVVKHH